MDPVPEDLFALNDDCQNPELGLDVPLSNGTSGDQVCASGALQGCEFPELQASELQASEFQASDLQASELQASDLKASDAKSKSVVNMEECKPVAEVNGWDGSAMSTNHSSKDANEPLEDDQHDQHMEHSYNIVNTIMSEEIQCLASASSRDPGNTIGEGITHPADVSIARAAPPSNGVEVVQASDSSICQQHELMALQTNAIPDIRPEVKDIAEPRSDINDLNLAIEPRYEPGIDIVGLDPATPVVDRNFRGIDTTEEPEVFEAETPVCDKSALKDCDTTIESCSVLPHQHMLDEAPVSTGRLVEQPVSQHSTSEVVVDRHTHSTSSGTAFEIQEHNEFQPANLAEPIQIQADREEVVALDVLHSDSLDLKVKSEQPKKKKVPTATLR